MAGPARCDARVCPQIPRGQMRRIGGEETFGRLVASMRFMVVGELGVEDDDEAWGCALPERGDVVVYGGSPVSPWGP